MASSDHFNQASMSIPLQDFQLFHSIDRELYTLLVTDIYRDPVESLQIIALWMWLERNGFYNIITKILSLPAILINEIADEAVLCLSYVNSGHSLFSPEAGEVTLTQSLVKKDFSLQYLQDNRDVAFRGIARIKKEVCIRAFSDLMEEALRRNHAQRLAENTQKLFQQAFPHRFGHVTFNNDNNNGSSSRSDANNINGNVVPAEERTMFVTFSKGYPVTEEEVREFFDKLCGDCIESFYMQEVNGGGEHALFARIVFFRGEIINEILNGVSKAKFSINGKHVWMRKYVPKRPRMLPQPLVQQQQSGSAST